LFFEAAVNDPADGNGRELDERGLPAAGDWEHVLRLAWRPAWSMRSRKGCLAPLADWWRLHRFRARR
jgi:hypothetical protein